MTRASRPTKTACRTARRSKRQWKWCYGSPDRALGRGSGSCRRALRPGLQLGADVRRPAGLPARTRSICERPGIGRGPAHPHPGQDWRGVRVRTVAPKLCEHNAEIFGRLGLSEAEMKEMHARGIL